MGLSGVRFNTVHANDFSFREELNAVVQCEPAESFNPELVGAAAPLRAARALVRQVGKLGDCELVQ